MFLKHFNYSIYNDDDDDDQDDDDRMMILVMMMMMNYFSMPTGSTLGSRPTRAGRRTFRTS